METLRKKNDARVEYYHSMMKKLDITAKQFAEDAELRKRIDSEFEEIWAENKEKK
jgi:hypothetical protein